jgi:predicted ATP-dependent endonuclease of OLD family
MKLLSVTIKNFRSIRHAVVSGPVNDVWTFIGQNNAGKSSVIHAIRAFYGDYDVTAEDFCRTETADTPVEITHEYQLSDDELQQLPEFYKLPENRLRVIKRFSKENLKGVSHGFEFKDGSVVEREEEFFGARNVQVGKLGSIIYVPAVKDLAEELKKTKSSIFTKLVSRIISEALTTLPSWNGLVEQAKTFAQDLRSPVKDSADGNLNSVHEIEESLTEMLSSWRLKSQIVVAPPTPEDIVLAGSRLRFLSEDTEQEEDPLTLGSGAQRSIVNSLLLLWSRIETKKAKADKKKFNGELALLLYEEPEALLHYDQEKKLLKNLEEIACSTTGQVILCTHSPNLVSTKNKALTSISRFVKDGKETKIFRAAKSFLDQLASEEGVFDFVLWLNSDRNTMFFVDKVVLVEGPSDKAFLNYLIAEQDIGANVYIVDCGMKSNIPRFMQLCSEFGVKHAVMYDKDDESKPNHATWNANISAAKNEFTLEVKELSPDLETYIGFTAPREGYKKPVEILTQLKGGSLASDKVTEFVTFIQN